MNNWGARQVEQPRVPAQKKKASKPLAVKICGGCSSGRNSQPHRRVHWRDQQDPRSYTNPPTWESATEGPNLLVGSEVTKNWRELNKQHCSLSDHPPHTVLQHRDMSCPTLVNI